MGTGYWVSRIVYAAAKLDLADHLAGGPKSAAELAGPTRTHAPSLHRLMRTLASLGVLSEDVNHRFALTPLGEALKAGAPGSARATILALAGDWWWHGGRKSSGRLLIIEMALPAGDTPHPGKVLDIAMLVMPGGQERPKEEYGTLLSKAGFRLTRVVPTKSAVSAVEATPV
jgi:hypothetical protein